MRLGISFESFEIWKDRAYSVSGFADSNNLVILNKSTGNMTLFESSDELLESMSFYFRDRDEKPLTEAIEIWSKRTEVQVLTFRLPEEGHEREFLGSADIQLGSFILVEGVQLWEKDGKPSLKFPIDSIEMDSLGKELLKRKLTKVWFQSANGRFETPEAKISIQPIINGGARKATVRVDMHGVSIRDIEIREGKYGLFVAFPSIRTSEGWKTPVWFQSKNTEEELKKEILFKFEEWKKERTNPEQSFQKSR